MPFIVPLILGAALVEELGPVVVGLIELAGTVALSFGLSYLAKILTPKPSTPSSLGGVQTTVQFGANLPRSALFGMQATAGALLYWNADGTNNDNLQMVYAVGDGLHDSLAGMYIAGLPVTIESTPVSLSWGSGYPVTEYRTGGVIGGTPKMLVRFFNGSDSQAADSDLVSHANPPGRWSSNNTLTGICYVSITLAYDTNVYSSGAIPQFLFVVKGLRCYDVRKDSTVGGSGAHRWGTQSTYEWTANPAIGLYNYQRGVWVNGNLVLGMGLSTADMVQNAYVAAANSCDDAITLRLGAASISSISNAGTGHAVGDVLTLTGGTFTTPIQVRVDTIDTAHSNKITHATIIQSGQFTVAAGNPVVQGSTSGSGINASFNLTWTTTENRYRVGMQVAANVQHRDAITAFLSSMAGTLLEDAGVFAPQAGVAQTVALSFTDSDLVAGQSQVYSSHRSRADLINAVFGTYSEPAQNWASISSPPRVSSTDATTDGEELAVSIDFPMIYSGTQAQRVEEITRKLARLQATATITLPFKFSVLEPGDWVTWTSARFNFTKTFLISITTLNLDQTITLTLREIASTAFDWTASADELSGTSPTNLAAFNALTTTVSSFSIAALQINAPGSITTPALTCSWTAITDTTITAVLVQYRIQGDSNVLNARFDDPTTGLGLIISGIQSGAIYEARATVETKPPRTTTYTSWVNTGAAVGNQVVSGSTPPAGTVGLAALDATLTLELNDTIAASQDAAAQLFALGNDLSSVSMLATAHFATTDANVTTAASAAANALQGVADLTTSVGASLASAISNISLDLATLASINDTLASLQYDVSANYGNLSANGQFQIIASVDPTGSALALIDMQVNASIGGSFASAGIQIAAYIDSFGVPYSRLQFSADSTEFRIPDVDGGDPFAPFLVEQVNGVPQIALRPDAIPDGAITTRTMDNGLLGTITTVNSSDVVRTLTGWNNGGAGGTIISATIVVGVGSSLLIDFNTVLKSSSTPTTVGGFIALYVNSTLIKSFPHNPNFTNTGMTLANSFKQIVNNCPGGSTVITVLMYNNNTSATATMTTVAPQLLLQEMADPIVVDASATITTSVAYQTSLVGDTSGTFTATAIGSADPYRVVVVAVGWVNSNNTPTLTVGGVAANRLQYQTDWFGRGYRLALFEVPYPSGTTADIIVSIAGSPKAIQISVWKVVASSHVPSYSGNGYTYDASTTIANVGPIGALAGQVLIAAGYGTDGSATFTGTWTGTGTPTERADAATSTTPNLCYSAYDMAVTVSESKHFWITESDATQPIVAVAGVWQ